MLRYYSHFIQSLYWLDNRLAQAYRWFNMGPYIGTYGVNPDIITHVSQMKVKVMPNSEFFSLSLLHVREGLTFLLPLTWLKTMNEEQERRWKRALQNYS